ncbi:MazG-like family protein [Peptoniphilus lacydonensis]|uniref:MazG-like family protein n=1 Tax=Peptoniphilus lacydonensis TaxID=1673725 RepID=UPI002907332B|nr:MazG-like family protein [Peptoniphilus lacydonensis]MDU5377352.1 MazG-like family protein [Peptoniphilus lacydonensis]MDU5436197.1 MazG-like family protein [Peptoniphilus lacydonensis]
MFEKLSKKIIKWAKDKDLLHRKNAEKQFMKFIEEVFEFKSEFDLVERTDHDKLREIYIQRMILEMGDIIVTLIILCKQIDIDPIICLEKAYKKIEARTGKTINGTFVKSEDL